MINLRYKYVVVLAMPIQLSEKYFDQNAFKHANITLQQEFIIIFANYTDRTINSSDPTTATSAGRPTSTLSLLNHCASYICLSYGMSGKRGDRWRIWIRQLNIKYYI